MLEPIVRKLSSAVGHVLSAENAHLKHFFGRELRFEIRVEVLPSRFNQRILIPLLHFIIYDNALRTGFGDDHCLEPDMGVKSFSHLSAFGHQVVSADETVASLQADLPKPQGEAVSFPVRDMDDHRI